MLRAVTFVLGGDISNNAPPVLYVVWNWLGNTRLSEVRSRIRKHRTFHFTHTHSRENVGQLSRELDAGRKAFLILIIEDDRPEYWDLINSMKDYIDQEQLPFANIKTYPTRQELARAPSYEQNVAGVVDHPGFAMVYGSYFHHIK